MASYIVTMLKLDIFIIKLCVGGLKFILRRVHIYLYQTHHKCCIIFQPLGCHWEYQSFIKRLRKVIAIHWLWVHPVSTAFGIIISKECLIRKTATLTVRGGSFLEWF